MIPLDAQGEVERELPGTREEDHEESRDEGRHIKASSGTTPLHPGSLFALTGPPPLVASLTASIIGTRDLFFSSRPSEHRSGHDAGGPLREFRPTIAPGVLRK